MRSQSWLRIVYAIQAILNPNPGDAILVERRGGTKYLNLLDVCRLTGHGPKFILWRVSDYYHYHTEESFGIVQNAIEGALHDGLLMLGPKMQLVQVGVWVNADEVLTHLRTGSIVVCGPNSRRLNGALADTIMYLNNSYHSQKQQAQYELSGSGTLNATEVELITAGDRAKARKDGDGKPKLKMRKRPRSTEDQSVVAVREVELPATQPVETQDEPETLGALFEEIKTALESGKIQAKPIEFRSTKQVNVSWTYLEAVFAEKVRRELGLWVGTQLDDNYAVLTVYDLDATDDVEPAQAEADTQQMLDKLNSDGNAFTDAMPEPKPVVDSEPEEVLTVEGFVNGLIAGFDGEVDGPWVRVDVPEELNREEVLAEIETRDGFTAQKRGNTYTKWLVWKAVPYAEGIIHKAAPKISAKLHLENQVSQVLREIADSFVFDVKRVARDIRANKRMMLPVQLPSGILPLEIDILNLVKQINNSIEALGFVCSSEYHISKDGTLGLWIIANLNAAKSNGRKPVKLQMVQVRGARQRVLGEFVLSDADSAKKAISDLIAGDGVQSVVIPIGDMRKADVFKKRMLRLYPGLDRFEFWPCKQDNTVTIMFPPSKKNDKPDKLVMTVVTPKPKTADELLEEWLTEHVDRLLKEMADKQLSSNSIQLGHKPHQDATTNLIEARAREKLQLGELGEVGVKISYPDPEGYRTLNIWVHLTGEEGLPIREALKKKPVKDQPELQVSDPIENPYIGYSETNISWLASSMARKPVEGRLILCKDGKYRIQLVDQILELRLNAVKMLEQGGGELEVRLWKVKNLDMFMLVARELAQAIGGGNFELVSGRGTDDVFAIKVRVGKGVRTYAPRTEEAVLA